MDTSSTSDRSRRRACANCIFAKAKCTPRTPVVCERCQRLGKSCVYGPVSKTRRLPGDSTRVQRLEQKVENLAAQLSALTKQSHQSSTGLNGTLPSSYTPGSQSHDVASSGSPSSAELLSSDDFEALGAGPAQSKVNGTARRHDIVDYGDLSLHQMDELLHVFRHDYFPEFPFILLPSEETPLSLRRSKPFLLLSIVAATSYTDSPLQRQLGREIQRQIAIRIIINNERSLDVLQGLLVHLAWHQYFLQPQSPRIMLLLQLCINLVNEMGLGRDHSARLPAKSDEIPALQAHSEPARGDHSLCEMRAFLGTYYLCSGLSKTFGKQDIIGHTGYVDRCCDRLIQQSQLASDRWLKRLVDFETLWRRVGGTFKYSDPEECKIRGESSICAIVDGFERELENLKAATAVDALDHETTLLHGLTFLDAWIHEVAFHPSLWDTHASGGSRIGPPPTNAQLQMLWRHLAVGKTFFDTFLSIETGKIFDLTFVTWVRLSYMIAVYCKAVLFHNKSPSPAMNGGCGVSYEWSSPGQQSVWDSALAAREADFQRVGGMIEEKIRSVATDSLRKGDDNDPTLRFSHCMKSILKRYERELQGINRKATENATVRISGISGHAGHAVATSDTESWNSSVTGASLTQLGDDITQPTADVRSGFPVDFQVDAYENIVWESLMNDFTVLPQP